MNESSIIGNTFSDRQELFCLGPQDWEDMDNEVRGTTNAACALAGARVVPHCNRRGVGAADTPDVELPRAIGIGLVRT